jgi:23S rRNA pseudouridine1911/1915/1917 synthase
LPISRDLLRRIRMTTKRAGGRTAVSHWKVLKRIGSPKDGGAYGKFTLVEVRIETGRTHQIRVHLSAIGYPVVGDYLYGAPHKIRKPGVSNAEDEGLELERNFLHAAELEFVHPGSKGSAKTNEKISLRSELPEELTALLKLLEG